MIIRILISCAAVMLGGIFFVLQYSQLRQTRNHYFSTFQRNQDALAEKIISRVRNQVAEVPVDITTAFTLDITRNFQTSSSMYCIVAKEDNIVFLRDETSSINLNDERLSSLFIDNKSTKDQQTYIISQVEAKIEGNHYTLVVCTRKTYLEKQIGYDKLQLHVLGIFVIYALILLVMNFILFYVIRSKEKRILRLESDSKQNRTIINKLEEDKTKNYVYSIKKEKSNFYHTTVINEVIAQMTLEDELNCIQVDIYIHNLKMEHFVMITKILSDNQTEGILSCYWKDNQFKVLLLHANKEKVQQFIDYFLNKYQLESHESIDEIEVVTSDISKDR